MRPHFPLESHEQPLKQEGGFSAVLCDGSGASSIIITVIIIMRLGIERLRHVRDLSESVSGRLKLDVSKPCPEKKSMVFHKVQAVMSLRCVPLCDGLSASASVTSQ